MELHPSPDQNGNGTTNYASHGQLCSFSMLFYDGLFCLELLFFSFSVSREMADERTSYYIGPSEFVPYSVRDVSDCSQT